MTITSVEVWLPNLGASSVMREKPSMRLVVASATKPSSWVWELVPERYKAETELPKV
jgi:hypothetical protein